MNLEQSEVLVDRALVTLCAELPESLGLYNTAKDQFTVGAIRSVPLLENLLPESRKHYMIRDWMRTYVEHEDQPLGNDISFDSLREIMKAERKQRAKEAREKHGDLMSDEEDAAPVKKKKKDQQVNGKSKAAINHKKKAAAAAADARAKRKPRANDSDESEAEVDDSSTTSLSSDESSSSDSSSSDDDRRSRNKAKTRKTTKGKDKRSPHSKSSTNKSKTKSGKSNLPPIEVVLSSEEDDDEPDALFDTDDPDVYEVETILEKRRGDYGEPDMYLIKWVGYEETTWEPAENVSKDLIEEFEGQPVRENEYVVEEILDRRSVRDKETRLRTYKYYVKWVGYEDKTWEPAENLPHNLRRKFDAKYEARKRRRLD